METCVFCQIIQGDLKANIRYRDEHVIAFDDHTPSAPVHLLIVPLRHIATLNDCSEHSEDTKLLGHILQTAKQLAKQLGIAKEGYRTTINCNAAGGQVVYHLHCHVQGGKRL
jgi:histidine triad (HIT) family protein